MKCLKKLNKKKYLNNWKNVMWGYVFSVKQSKKVEENHNFIYTYSGISKKRVRAGVSVVINKNYEKVHQKLGIY